jgi:hypothetical protein
LFIGSHKIMCLSRALPILSSDVQGHNFNNHHSYLIPVWLSMLCTKDALKSVFYTLCRRVCKVYVQCFIHAVIKCLRSTVHVLIINRSIISVHSFLRRTVAHAF